VGLLERLAAAVHEQQTWSSRVVVVLRQRRGVGQRVCLLLRRRRGARGEKRLRRRSGQGEAAGERKASVCATERVVEGKIPEVGYGDGCRGIWRGGTKGGMCLGAVTRKRGRRPVVRVAGMRV
jgi:hypothetical protein